jgi:HlyD family secretion protein
MYIPSFISKHRVASAVIGVCLLLVVAGVFLLMRPKTPQYVTSVVSRGDLQQTVEAVGTIISERDLELKFPSAAGVLDSVEVKEGDSVTAGQVLARMRAGNLAAAVSVQAANVQSALADLSKIEAGTRPEDIAIAEAQVQNKRASLQVAQASLESAKQNLEQAKQQLKTLQQEADTSLSGQVETAKSTIASQLIVGETALSSVEDVLNKTIVQDALIKARPGDDQSIRQQRFAALSAISNVRRQAASVSNYHDALSVLQGVQTVLSQANDVVSQLFSLIDSLPETAYFKSSDRETYKTSLSTQRSLAQSAVNAVASAYTGLQSASASYDTRISSAQATITTNEGLRQRSEADILTYQTALQAQEADLAGKKAGSRPQDIDAARARLRQAQAALAQASATYNDTILRAPIDGVITHVNIKPGESLPITAAVTLLGHSPFRVETYVSEVDVPKLVVSQSGSIELDAFPGISYKLHVSEIDPTQTQVEGVSKYRAKLDFLYPHSEFKIGMSGDVTVITGERMNVLKVPLRAVLSKSDGSKYVRVLAGKQMIERPVVTGMEGQSGDVEVTQGVSDGEMVVVLTK